MEWNSLKAADKSRIIRTAVEHGITDLEEVKSLWRQSMKQPETYDDGGILYDNGTQSTDNPPMGRANPDNWREYMDWAYAASSKLSKEWDEPESFIFFDMLNSNDYDYKAFYDEDPERAWQWLESPEGSHFDDVGKTVYHPSFSDESMYSANNYGDMGTGANPDNIEGPAWNDNNQLIDQEGNVVFDENSYAKGGSFRKYKKESERIADEYGMLGTQEDLTRRQYRRNKESLWQGLEQTENMYRNLYNSPLVTPDLQQRAESYSEGNEIPLNYNANPYNTLRQTQMQAAIDNERYYRSQLTPEQRYENRIAARPDYKWVAELMNEVAMFPTWFIGGETVGRTAEALSRRTSLEALKRLDNVKNIQQLKKLPVIEQIKDNRKLINEAEQAFNYHKNYKKIPKSYALNTKKTNQAVRNLIETDNTFLRGIRDVDDISMDKKINRVLGRNPWTPTTQDERLKYMATYYAPDTGHGRDGMLDLGLLSGDDYGTIYTSNSMDTGAGYSNMKGSSRIVSNETDGKIAMVRRPLKFDNDRHNWIKDNSFGVYYVNPSEGVLEIRPNFSKLDQTPGRQLKQMFFNSNWLIPDKPVINSDINRSNIVFSTEKGRNNLNIPKRSLAYRTRNNTPKFEPDNYNYYNHYIFVGPTGTKGLDFIKFIEPDETVAKLTRAHTGVSTKGYSRRPTITEPFPYWSLNDFVLDTKYLDNLKFNKLK